MSVPEPILPLQEHCSVIHDDVLYVYSPDGLQSLPLRNDAAWNQEPTGISVTGASCVLGSMDGDYTKSALYIVGGATNSSTSDYPGLQRYSFRDRRWDTIEPVTPVTQNRQRHGAAFLNASSSILVFAGSQDGRHLPSTQTFVIDTWPPYAVRSFTSIAPPTVDPAMLSWSDDRAAMIGGSLTNDRLYTFGAEDGWVDAGVALIPPPPNKSRAQSAVLSLDDGSKVLMTLDFSQSPNRISRTVVLNSGGRPASFGQTVGDGADRSRLRSRELLLSTFPTYNDSLAPTTVRDGAAIAQDARGLTVVSGGKGQEPLSIFDALENRWVSASDLLGDRSQTPSTDPTSPSTSETAESPASTAAPADPSTPPLTILGIVLGVICGIALLLIVALLFLRSKKRKNPQQQSDEKFSSDKSHRRSRLSFDDQSLQPIRPAAQPMGSSIPGLKRSRSPPASSGAGNTKSHTHHPNGTSFGTGLFSHKKYPVVFSRPLPHQEPAELQERSSTSAARPLPSHSAANPRATHRKANSSWSTYFSGNTAMDGGDAHKIIGSIGSRRSSRSHKGHQLSASVPTPNLRIITPGLTDSRGNQLEKLSVNKGSPIVEHMGQQATMQGVPMKEGIPAEISRSDSITSSTANPYDHRRPVANEPSVSNGYPQGPPTDDYGWVFQDSTWSGPPHRLNRPPSSLYTSSIQSPAPSASKHEEWSKPSVRPVTQWPNNIMSFPSAPLHRPVPSESPNVPPDESEGGRDFFGSKQPGEPSETSASWLNLAGSPHANRPHAPGDTR